MHDEAQPLPPKRQATALGVYDPLSAAIADRAGADYLWVSSYSLSTSQGVPDVGAISIPLQESLLTRIRMVSKVPMIVDLDNASRSQRHCTLLADKLLQLGVQAVSIEDKAEPKESSLYKSDQVLYTPHEFRDVIGFVRARAPSLKVFARLEGLNYGEPTPVTMRKARLCSEAGVDHLVLHNTSPTTDQLAELVSECSQLAKIAIIPTTYLRELPTMKHLPVSLFIFANQLLRAGVAHSMMVARALHSSPHTVDELIASIELINSLIPQ